MKTNIITWWVICAFFFSSAVLYTVWNLISYGSVEWAGTIALLFVAIMAALVGFYLIRVYKAQGGEAPEDLLTADVDDGDPEVGEFAPWSWWPLVLAGSAGVFMIGLSVGTWMTPIGLAIFVVAIVGWVFEFYRGHFAR